MTTPPDSFIAGLVGTNALRDKSHDTVRLALDLAGFDGESEELVTETVQRVRYATRDKRSGQSLLAVFGVLSMSNRELGEAIGMPQSTVQAMQCGRVPERLTRDQRKRLTDLFRVQLDACKKALARLEKGE